MQEVGEEIHIISTGLSLITNAQKNGVIDAKIKISDEAKWKEIFDNPLLMDKLLDFLRSDPKKFSAEINTFLRVVEGKPPQKIEVFLVGTNTYSNEIARTVIRRFLQEQGYLVLLDKEFSGYFWESQFFDETKVADEFQKGVINLLDQLIFIAQTKKKKGYRVFFNPTGGLKAHVIATALAGFLTNSEMYYMNEEFSNVVFLPLLFYIPKGREIKILKEIEKLEKSEKNEEFDKALLQFEDELERLEIYGIIHIKRAKNSDILDIKLTNRGRLILDWLTSP